MRPNKGKTANTVLKLLQRCWIAIVAYALLGHSVFLLVIPPSAHCSQYLRTRLGEVFNFDFTRWRSTDRNQRWQKESAAKIVVALLFRSGLYVLRQSKTTSYIRRNYKFRRASYF